MKSSQKLLAPGSRFLLRLRGAATVDSALGRMVVRATGEAVVRIEGDSEDRRKVSVQRLTLATSPIRTYHGESGIISVLGDPAQGALRLGEKGDRLGISGPARIHYPELDVKADIDQQKGCYYRPTLLPASFRLDGVITARRNRLSGKIRLSVACLAGEGEAFTSLILEAAPDWQRLLPSGGEASNTNCHTSLQTDMRRLTVQPVGFRDSATDATPSGSTATAQIATAAAVWAKCCIEIDANPIHLITDATLKTSSDQAAIRASYTHPDADTIEIFFVQNPLTASGGGNAGAIGVASQKIVIAEPNGGNPVLVAHEIGHALGLLHPPGSDWGTVLEPTGSAMVAGTEFVTHMMCEDISQPALETLTETCCMAHDSGDHYIRDFPEDSGNEPSDPLPAGRTRYSMSNVWNRLTNSAGAFGADGPDHQNPARFQSDGVTAQTNYLFARVEQVGTLPVRDVTVKFYLKHPGSGGGAANLTLLGEAAMAGTPPQNVSIPWQVPAGTPNHSCVFAVVRSPAEPEDEPSALDWWEFEALSRADNDWAQRNLDIRNAAPAGGSGNVFSPAPMVILIPRQMEGEAVLRLTLDARNAVGLENLTAEVCGRDPRKIPPGKVVRLQEEVRPGSMVAVFLRGTIPTRAPKGRSYAVNIEPRLGKVDLVGYTSELRVTPHHEYLAQFKDTLLAAADDLARAADLAPACRMACKARKWMAGQCLTTETTAEMATELADDVGEIVRGLRRRAEAKAFCLEGAFEEWRMALEAGHPADIVEGLFVVAQRLQMVAWAMLNPA